MKPNPTLRTIAVLLAIAGLLLVIASGLIATRSFVVHKNANGTGHRYDCGSVLFAKDPRNLVPKGANVPAALNLAYTRCERLRNSRTHKATNYMVAGVIPLLLVLALPAITRRSRRAKVRRRSRM